MFLYIYQIWICAYGFGIWCWHDGFSNVYWTSHCAWYLTHKKSHLNPRNQVYIRKVLTIHLQQSSIKVFAKISKLADSLGFMHCAVLKGSPTHFSQWAAAYWCYLLTFGSQKHMPIMIINSRHVNSLFPINNQIWVLSFILNLWCWFYIICEVLLCMIKTTPIGMWNTSWKINKTVRSSLIAHCKLHQFVSEVFDKMAQPDLISDLVKLVLFKTICSVHKDKTMV